MKCAELLPLQIHLKDRRLIKVLVGQGNKQEVTNKQEAKNRKLHLKKWSKSQLPKKGHGH